MRNALFVTAIILIFNNTLIAQKTATWKGGASGNPTEWNCPANWREGRVPNEFSDVIIPNLEAKNYPVIRKNVDDINTLLLMTEAILTIDKKGSLTIYERVEIAQGGIIQNKGRLYLPFSEITTTKNHSTVLLAKKAGLPIME